MIQDCYQKLLAPGGLDSFRPAPGREAGDAFGAWLWTVVHHHCNNKVHYLLAQPGVAGAGLESVPEARDAITPDQAFAREHIRQLSERTVAQVAPTWRAKGPEWSERLDVLLQLICEREADAARACERLGIKDGHGRKLKHDLCEDIRREWRKQIRSDLFIEPGLSPQAIELMIDREIETLLQAAYPGSGVSALFASDPEAGPDAQDEEPESAP